MKTDESRSKLLKRFPLNSSVLLAFINIQRIHGSHTTNASRPPENVINVLGSKVAHAHMCAHPTFKISLFILPDTALIHKSSF